MSVFSTRPPSVQTKSSTSLNVQQLACSRNQRSLFSGVEFSLCGQQALQIEGPNGSGKTSLLRILCLLSLADSGEIYWNGQNVEKDREQYLANIAYVAHNNGIKHELTVNENLQFSAAMAGVKSPDVRLHALDRVGLTSHYDALAGRLSAGQRRRVALARLLLTQAPLWILDEPLTALDASSVETIESLLREHVISGGMLILTTHRHVDLDGCHINHLNLAS